MADKYNGKDFDFSKKYYLEEDLEETEEDLEFDEDAAEKEAESTSDFDEEDSSEDEAEPKEEFSPVEQDNLEDEFGYEAQQTALKSKKYVIQIYPDNVPLMESMETEERSEYINELIIESQNKENEEHENKQVSHSIKQIIVIIFTIILGLPIIFYLINVSLSMTSDNYKQIQTNFEKLYLDRGRLSR